MKAILFSLTTIILLACNSRQNSFQEYYERIPVVKLPLTINCGFDHLLPTDSLWADTTSKMYLPRQSDDMQIFGRVFENDNNIYICYGMLSDIRYPWLYVYSRQGELLDSLYLHIQSCDSDETFDMINSTIIYPDKSIEMRDTSQYYRIDTILNDRVHIYTVVTKSIYKIADNGKPVLFSEKVDTI